MSINATPNRAGAVAVRPRIAASTYESVRSTWATRSRWTLRYVAIWTYGCVSTRRIARGKSLRNGTSGIAASRSGTRPATAIASPPPWLPPITATRAGSTAGWTRIASTARTASVMRRR